MPSLWDHYGGGGLPWDPAPVDPGPGHTPPPPPPPPPGGAQFPWQPGFQWFWDDDSANNDIDLPFDVPWHEPPPPGPGEPGSPGTPGSDDPVPQVPFPTTPPPTGTMPSDNLFDPAYGYYNRGIDQGLETLRNSMSLRGVTGGQALDIEKDYLINARTNAIGQLANMGQQRGQMALAEAPFTGFYGGRPTQDYYKFLSGLALQEGDLTGYYSSAVSHPGGFTYDQIRDRDEQQQEEQNAANWLQYLGNLLMFFL